jgi:hypothetical protein
LHSIDRAEIGGTLSGDLDPLTFGALDAAFRRLVR